MQCGTNKVASVLRTTANEGRCVEGMTPTTAVWRERARSVFKTIHANEGPLLRRLTCNLLRRNWSCFAPSCMSPIIQNGKRFCWEHVGSTRSTREPVAPELVLAWPECQRPTTSMERAFPTGDDLFFPGALLRLAEQLPFGFCYSIGYFICERIKHVKVKNRVRQCRQLRRPIGQFALSQQKKVLQILPPLSLPFIVQCSQTGRKAQLRSKKRPVKKEGPAVLA